MLDQPEWKDVQWRSDPKESDTNSDGRLSKAEFCERMVKHWNWGRKQGASPAASGTGSFGTKRTSGGPSSDSKKGDDNSKVRKYAKSLLTQYDANKNGVLDKEEWSKMRGSPGAADKNGDGKITLDELTARLASYGKRGSSGSRTASNYSSGRSRSYGPSSRTTSGGEVYRFKSPTERLPRGLPDWFARSDTNGDGQIAMSEYAATWSDSKADEFDRFDLNADGFVTPEECLAAERDE
jgi:Ca2+-binding EF-hand superfamily protein